MIETGLKLKTFVELKWSNEICWKNTKKQCSAIIHSFRRRIFPVELGFLYLTEFAKECGAALHGFRGNTSLVTWHLLGFQLHGVELLCILQQSWDWVFNFNDQAWRNTLRMTLVLANSGWLNPFQKLPEHLQQGTQFATNALSLKIMMKNRYKSHTAVIVWSLIAKAEVASGASENLASNDWCQITKAVKFNEDPFFFAGLYAALYVARML